MRNFRILKLISGSKRADWMMSAVGTVGSSHKITQAAQKTKAKCWDIMFELVILIFKRLFPLFGYSIRNFCHNFLLALPPKVGDESLSIFEINSAASS